MFYLPRICEHCLNPSCAASCPSGAMYKREEDGITPPEAAHDLFLDLLRPQAEARTCPRCGQTLQHCRLALAQVELDRVLVEVGCAACGASFTL